MTIYLGFQYSVTYGTAVICTEVTLCWPFGNQCETVQLLTLIPDFIAPALRTAKSPDLNPVDYTIWGELQESVYRSQIRDVDPLKSRLIEGWEHFQQVFINEAIRQGPRLLACIRAHGGHFEQRL